jgi:hypothetical protein
MSLFDSASLVVTPNGVKEGKLYSIKPTDGSGDLSVTRATTATRVNSAGLVEVVPRNFLRYSQQFNDGAWQILNSASVSANTTTAPDGTLTADTLTFSANASSSIYQTISIPQGQTTLSIYAKVASGTKQFRLRIDSPSGNESSNFTATTEWQRFTFPLTITGTGVVFYVINGSSATAGSLFIWGSQLEQGATATDYYPTTTRLNIPRLDYTNGSCPSILVEPQRTNIFAKSQTTSTWSFTNISRTANNGISPDGTQNADLLFPTTSGAVSFNSDNTASSLVVGQPFVCSFFIKLNTSFTSNVGANIIDLRLSGAAVWTRPTIRVNFETGEVTNVSNASYISSTNYGNGWYRITFGAIPTGTGASVGLQSPTGVTLNGGSFYIWGLQGESNSTYATSYVPTQGSSVTRNADVISKTGISSLIGQTEGTAFIDYIPKSNYPLAEQNLLTLYNSSSIDNNNIQFFVNSSQQIIIYVLSSGSVVANINTGVSALNSHKIALGYKANDLIVYIDGIQVGSDTSLTVPALNSIVLNNYAVGNYMSASAFKNVTLWKTKLTNDQLAQLTTL